MIIPFTQGIPKIWTCSACSLEDTPLKFVTWNLKMAHSKRRFTFFIIRFYLELWRCTDVYCNYQLIYVRTLLPRNSVPDWSVNSFLFLGNNMTWLDLVLFFPTCQVRVVRFYVSLFSSFSCTPPPSSSSCRPPPRRISTAIL